MLGSWLGGVERGVAAVALGLAFGMPGSAGAMSHEPVEAGPPPIRLVVPAEAREASYFLERAKALGLRVPPETVEPVVGLEVPSVSKADLVRAARRSKDPEALDSYRELLELGGLRGISVPSAEQLFAAGSGGDYVVIAPPELHSGLAPLLRHRLQAGHRPVLVSPSTIEEATGTGGAEAIVSALRRADEAWSDKPRFVLLVSHRAAFPGAPAVQHESREDVGHDLTARWFTSDHRISDLDGDHRPELAVGRLPVWTAEQLGATVDKLIDYDIAPPAQWQLRASLIDGDPAWGRMINGIVGAYGGRRFRANASAPVLPERSSFNPTVTEEGPAGAREVFRDTLEGGRLVVSYFGHGDTHAIDGLSVRDVINLDVGARHPVVVIIACHAGCLVFSDSPTLASTLVTGSGGAVAAIAASDVTLPHDNADFGERLARGMTRRDAPTIGETFARAKQDYHDGNTQGSTRFVRKVGDAIVRDVLDVSPASTLYLYNLFGDPATPLRSPLPLEVRLTGRSVAGGHVVVRVELPEEERISEARAYLQSGEGRILAGPVSVQIEGERGWASIRLPRSRDRKSYAVRVELIGERNVFSGVEPLRVRARHSRKF